MSNWTGAFKNPIDYLTQESAITDLLLLETSDQIVLEQTGQSESLWNNLPKN